MIDENQRDFKNILLLFICFFSSILSTYLLENPYANYLPFVVIALAEWYRSYPKEKRSYYGLCRLFFYMFVVTAWIILIFKIIIHSIGYLFHFETISLENFEHLFPYAFLFTCYARTKHDMDLNDKRRYLVHFLFDIPAFTLVIVFKFLNNPLNSLCSQITDQCYLGCLPLSFEVKQLHDLGIKYVINMCAEYSGPVKEYQKYEIEQLYLPTVDWTAPTFETIEKGVTFMRNATKNNGKVFVHCKAGISRSTIIIFCHLISNEHMSPKDALDLLKEKRPEITTSLIHYLPVKRFIASVKKN